MFGFLTSAVSILPLIVQAINSAESLVSASGAEKKTHAMDLVGDGLQIAERSTGKDLLNDAAVRDATGAVMDAIVTLIKVVETRPQPSSD